MAIVVFAGLAVACSSVAGVAGGPDVVASDEASSVETTSGVIEGGAADVEVVRGSLAVDEPLCATPGSANAVPNSQNVSVDARFADGTVRRVLAEFDLPPVTPDELRRGGLVVEVSDRAGTDYVTDGVDDHVEINLATAQVYAAGGGTVYLHAGTYVVSDSVYVWDRTTLRGEGRVGARRTTIALADRAPSMAGEAGIVRLKRDLADGPLERVFDVRIEDFVIDGNRANQPVFSNGAPDQEKKYGFYAEGERIVAQRITIQNSVGYGFDPHEHNDTIGSQVSILDSYAVNNLTDGFTLDAIFDSVIAHNVAWNNQRHGFNLVTGTNDITVCGNVSYENGLGSADANGAGTGIQVQGGSDPATQVSHTVRIRDNSVFANGRSGIELRGTFASEVSGNYVTRNGHSGIRLRGADRNIVIGNVVDGNSVTNDSAYEISLDDYSDGVRPATGSDRNTLKGNRLRNTNDRLLREGPLATRNSESGNVFETDR